MGSPSTGPAEAPIPGRRRTSSARSSGLDYSTTYRVDEDILSRIRALVLSRNKTCPPRTPHPSDERNPPQHEPRIFGSFDFTTARSVAGSAKSEAGLLDTEKEACQLGNQDGSMDVDACTSRRPTVPNVRPRAFPPKLRSSSSANDVGITFNVTNDSAVDTEPLQKSPPSSERKRFRLPRLVLRDIKDSDPLASSRIAVQSCFPDPLQYQRVPAEDTSAQDNYQPCPHCDHSEKQCPPPPSDKTKYDPAFSRFETLPQSPPSGEKTEIVCSPYCPPNCADHNVYFPLPEDVVTRKERLKSHIKIMNQDMMSLDHALYNISHRPMSTGPRSQKKGPSEVDISLLPRSKSASSFRTATFTNAPDTDNSQFPTRVSSISSIDTFPHVLTSEMVAQDLIPRPLSSAVVTNFSLPGPKAHTNPPLKDGARSQPIPHIQAKGSNSSLKSKPQTSSLLSGASRTSVRHSLLKPSITATQPVDTGLPAQPLLTKAESPPAVLTKSESTLMRRSPPPKTPLQPILADIAAAAAELSAFDPTDSEDNGDQEDDKRDNAPGYDRLVVEEFSPNSIKLGYMDKARPSVPVLTAVVTVPERLKSPDIVPSIPERHEAHTMEESARRRYQKLVAEQKSVEEIERQDFPQGMKVSSISTEAFPSIDPLNASYWGFVPAVKEAVHDAVQLAVRKAVHEIVVPPGTEKDEASDAYRMLVADSLADAAKSADNYLRRSSLWNEPPDSVRESSFGPEFQNDPRPKTAIKDFQPSNIEEQIESFNDTMEKLDRVLENDKLQEQATYPDRMEDIPLNTTDRKTRENRKQASMTQAPPMDSIPARGSSKQQVPKQTGTSNPSVVFSLSERGSRRGSKELSMLVAAGSRSQLRADRDNARMASDGRVNKMNTVHWLRELLTSNDAYSPRLTALPPRSRRREDLSGSSGRSRSQTAPVVPVGELFLGATPSPLETKPKIPGPTVTENGAAVAETFARTISDLEKLLNEALFIARQAADKDDNGYVPGLLGNAAAILKGGRKIMGKESYQPRPITRRTKRKEKMSSVESIRSAHESARSFSGTSTEGNSDSEPDGPKIDVTAPSGKRMKPVTTAAEDILSFAKTRDRSGTWNSERGLHALESTLHTASPERLQRQKQLSIPSMVDPQVSPLSGPPPMLDSSPDNPDLQPKTRTTSFQWQDISNFQSPEVRSQRTVATRDQVVRQQLYEEDESTLAKLPITELHNKTSVSNSLDGSLPSETVDFQTGFHHEYIMQHVEGRETTVRSRAQTSRQSQSRQYVQLKDETKEDNIVTNRGGSGKNPNMAHHLFNLDGKRHVSLKEHKGFSLARTHKRRPIARDWSPSRKRFAASVSCVSTALIGIVIGIYAGEVPSIQYLIVDLHHFTVLGNVFFFLGLAIPTTFFWPLPLLHGRKPYILGSMSIAMPLLFPQALAVGETRNPNLPGWRIGLMLSRGFMGFALGFANMNFLATLMDLFGASLQSSNPHQEIVDEFDVRRHGGGMGLWLGIWTWCYIGSIGIGFMIGACIINTLSPTWGFYTSIAILAVVLLINVVAPEVRRSAFRRSVSEVRTENSVSRRLAKGEVKMHRVHTGPKWWGEEFHHGILLSHSMLRQPGFLILACYVAWVYAQIVLVIILLGSLTSKYYKFKSPYVGASVASVPLGALLSVPFQKAGLFSRERTAAAENDDDTLKKKKMTLSSHFLRRSIFVLCLPFMGLAYTLSSTGPPTPFMLPIFWAGAIGFLSNLAVAECNGIIMETFDTSDLQPGMTGRPRSGSKGKVTNYSSFPRVCSAFAVTQGMGFCLAAIASGIGGVAQRHLGQQAATGVMCGILLILSILLIFSLVRFQDVQIIPESKTSEMEQWQSAKRAQYINGKDGDLVEDWRPVIIGNPTHIMRRMSVLELGSMTRWSEIRKKNQLVDAQSLEARHANLNTLVQVEHKLQEKERNVMHKARRNLSGSRDGSYDSKDRVADMNNRGGGEEKGRDYEGVLGGGFRGERDERRKSGKGGDEDEDYIHGMRVEMGKEPERERRKSGRGGMASGYVNQHSINRSRVPSGGGDLGTGGDSTVVGDLGGHREMDLGTPGLHQRRESSRMSDRTRSGVDRVDRAFTGNSNSKMRRGTVVSRGIEERD